MNSSITEFVVYIINAVANRHNLYPSYVYRKLDKTGCITDYLVPFYDVLHTMSSESVVDDVIEYVRLRGAEL